MENYTSHQIFNYLDKYNLLITYPRLCIYKQWIQSMIINKYVIHESTV